MKLYKVKVNGKLYEVELESVSENNAHISAPVVESKPVVSSEGGNKVVAPLSGKLVDIKVNVGDTVNAGDVVAVIEAMKLENEVPSAYSGTVKQIVASKGASVNNKDVLIILE